MIMEQRLNEERTMRYTHINTKNGNLARICNGPEGRDVHELTRDNGEIHANTFYRWQLRFHGENELLEDAGYVSTGEFDFDGDDYALLHELIGAGWTPEDALNDVVYTKNQ